MCFYTVRYSICIYVVITGRSVSCMYTIELERFFAVVFLHSFFLVYKLFNVCSFVLFYNLSRVYFSPEGPETVVRWPP